MDARINDIFLSTQGEGKYLGEEQCFVRFYHCDLGCDFCDTKLETFQKYSVKKLMETIKNTIGSQSIETVSITGGEPLLQRDFFVEFLPKLKKQGLRCYLETNGILYNELFDIIDYVDVIAMDIKLPSSTKQKGYWQEHKEFLKVAKQKDTFVKVVICRDTQIEDFEKAVDLVSNIDRDITFIIQPNSTQLSRELAEKMQAYKKYSKQHLDDVRLIPQLHKAVGIK